MQRTLFSDIVYIPFMFDARLFFVNSQFILSFDHLAQFRKVLLCRNFHSLFEECNEKFAKNKLTTRPTAHHQTKKII